MAYIKNSDLGIAILGNSKLKGSRSDCADDNCCQNDERLPSHAHSIDAQHNECQCQVLILHAACIDETLLAAIQVA